MTVTLFDDEIAKKFTEIYNKEYIKYETEKKNSGNSSNITFDDTPVTGDSFSIILVVIVAIISLGAAKIINKHRTSSLL